MEGGKKPWSLKEAKIKLAAFCAYQERCQQEARERLADKGIFGDDAEQLIVQMIEEGFINEDRFARAFARGKFRLKKWGRHKIQQELSRRNISSNCLKSAMKEIDEEEYWETLLAIAEKRVQSGRGKEAFVLRQQSYQYLLSRGYESSLIEEALKEVFSKQNF